MSHGKRERIKAFSSCFPIGTVMKLTDLTARQIRYYEDQGLIQPERNSWKSSDVLIK